MGFSPVQDRDALRVTTIYSLTTDEFETIKPVLRKDDPIGKTLNFSRLTTYVLNCGDLLPHCRFNEEIDTSFLPDNSNANTAYLSIYHLRNRGCAFAVLTVDFHSTISLLNLTLAQDYLFERLDILHLLLTLNPHLFNIQLTDSVRTKYQLTYLPASLPVPEKEEVYKLIYRADIEVDQSYVNLCWPDEMNRNSYAGCALSSLGAVMWGQQDYVENMTLLSAMLFVNAKNSIEHLTQGAICALDSVADIAIESHRNSKIDNFLRSTLAELANYQRQLALSIDSVSDIFPFIPSLRPASFHNGLFSYSSLDVLRARADRIIERARLETESKMSSLESLRAEILREKTRRWTVTISLTSVIAVPFSIVFGYLGMSASEVNSDKSMFDFTQYGTLYLTLSIITFLIFLIHLLSFLRALARRSKSQG